MSSEQNVALLRRMIEEAFNNRNPGIADELLATDHHHNLQQFPADQGGKDLAGQFLAAFPDLHVTIEEAFASDDTVASRGYWTGTFTNALGDIPPTGKQVKVSYIDFWKIKDGKFVANWHQFDQMALLGQPTAVSETKQDDAVQHREVGGD
jgi:predicted ester cyclase